MKALRLTQGDEQGSGQVRGRARSYGVLQIEQHVVQRQQRSSGRQRGHHNLRPMHTCQPHHTNTIVALSIDMGWAADQSKDCSGYCRHL